jgi:hypothetical protein
MDRGLNRRLKMLEEGEMGKVREVNGPSALPVEVKYEFKSARVTDVAADKTRPDVRRLPDPPAQL